MKPAPFTGRSLGPYKVLEKIAQGGMGQVYKGFHQALDRYVAIKVLPHLAKADPALAQRFQREAKAAAGLRHPNIVQVFDFGVQEDVYYLVMEYVQGTDLRAEMDRRRRAGKSFKPDEIVHLLGQVADALDYAHQHGVIHRDVKPANIFVTADRQAILGDFGLAMLRDRASQATMGHSFGTPEYIAPEQAIDSRAAVPASDIYSLGGIIYEMVTGQLPFDAESSISLALKHISEDPAPPSQYVPNLPPAVEAVILRALAKEPSARFPTARALIGALQQAWQAAPVRLARPAARASAEPQLFLPPTQPLSAPRAASSATARASARKPPPAQSPQPASSPRLAPLSPPSTPKRKGWPWVVGLGAVIILLIGVVSVFALTNGNPLSIVARPTVTSTRAPTIAATATLRLSPTALPTATPRPHTPTVLAVAPTSAQSPTPKPATSSATPSRTPAATATKPPATLTRTATASPAPTQTPTPTPTPTLVVGQALTRTVDSMTMRFIPGGAFLMGNADADAPDREKPQHEVTLGPFWMDQTEVTNAQYKLCVQASVCSAPVVRTAYDDPARANHPVAYVNWDGASAYCLWVAAQTGWDARLPTEAQWEKAASWDPQNAAKRRYPWGDDKPDATRLNFQDSYLNRTQPVDSYPMSASVYGLLNMAGNVWEWGADWYNQDYYRQTELPWVDPTGPDKGKEKIVRGGSYGYGAAEARTTFRNMGDPQKARGPDLGFRCAVNGERLP